MVVFKSHHIQENANRSHRRSLSAALLLICIASTLSVSGCRSLNRHRPKIVARPSKHSVRTEHVIVHSDFKIATDHEMVHELKDVRQRVMSELSLPRQREAVHVYLFSDESSYRRYLESTWPGLPPRRAYFVGTPRELAVYTFWGDRVMEDLRHEFTHGVLHACLTDVPLWLDEGLAEYFEVPGSIAGHLNEEYVQQLTTSVLEGWSPDLSRLEQLEEFSSMQHKHYREAWSWVHFMLHHSHDSRDALLAYLEDLRDNARPKPLSQRLKANVPQYELRFVNHVASLRTSSQYD